VTAVVIVGAGQAGHSLAISLRENGYEDTITLLESENALPYQRPPLSKEYLFAPHEPADVSLVSENEYGDLGITFLPGITVEAVDRVRREVILGSPATRIGSRPSATARAR
jgi:3-phenylpropionate/trans-cinnamate dioxygenase ferredoxin reductase component